MEQHVAHHGKRTGLDQRLEPFGRFKAGGMGRAHDVGEGAKWSATGKTTWRLQDGKPGSSISLDEAAAIAGRIGLAVPA